MCEGPLILEVDDSDPPQCDNPIAGLPVVAVMLYLAGAAVSTLIAGAWVLIETAWARPRN